jgi:signal peptide peptidase SppA
MAVADERLALPELRIPAFPRLDEYVGVWAMEPAAFRAFWDTVARTDLRAHMEAAPPALKPRTELVQAKGGQTVALVQVLGMLMKQQPSFGGTSTAQLRKEIRQAASDPNVSAILLGIDSPGGSTAGIDDLANDVKAARKSKPVWAFVEDLGASAAYWIASQAEVIYANSPTALVGSIGTILTVYDESEAADMQGVKPVVFATGPLKGTGTPGTAVTPEQQAYLQGLVNGVQEHFDAAVRTGRGMTAKELEAVRTGGVWKAEHALDLKLIDGVQSMQKTVDGLAQRAAAPPSRSRTAAEFTVLPMRRQSLPTLGG